MIVFSRSASAAATASFRSIADDEENVDSPSSDEGEKTTSDDIDNILVWLTSRKSSIKLLRCD